MRNQKPTWEKWQLDYYGSNAEERVRPFLPRTFLEPYVYYGGYWDKSIVENGFKIMRDFVRTVITANELACAEIRSRGVCL